MWITNERGERKSLQQSFLEYERDNVKQQNIISMVLKKKLFYAYRGSARDFVIEKSLWQLNLFVHISLSSLNRVGDAASLVSPCPLKVLEFFNLLKSV